MIVSIGTFRLKSIRHIFKFLRYAKKINLEAQSSKGNKHVAPKGLGLKHFMVISAWETEDDMKKFVMTNFHGEAVKTSPFIASEIKLLYFESDVIPNHQDALKLLSVDKRTRTMNFRK